MALEARARAPNASCALSQCLQDEALWRWLQVKVALLGLRLHRMYLRSEALQRAWAALREADSDDRSWIAGALGLLSMVMVAVYRNLR